ncbi:MAG: metal-dependent hydrolase [Thermodesulfobacteriota bacterium]|nr:metal-dependent hydrolase [Thermodesulfobacteriota bacterium]
MGDNSIKWQSHAFFSITTSKNKELLIDPWITGNPLCPITIENLVKADIVLVTHDHFDHCADAADISKKTGATLIGQPETVGRLKTDFTLPEENVVNNGIGMNIGGSTIIDGITITMTQAFHSSATGAPCGYIIRLEDGKTLYHAGDTGIFESMKTLGNIYGIDLALLPIGSCFTMDPIQAVEAVKLLGTKRVIPMHYKTFSILEQDADVFVRLAKKEMPSVKVIVLKPGEAFQI